jgi:hypothetical protein
MTRFFPILFRLRIFLQLLETGEFAELPIVPAIVFLHDQISGVDKTGKSTGGVV